MTYLPPCWRGEGTPAAVGGTASVVAAADGAELDFFSRSRLA